MAELARCRRCNALVRWAVTAAGRKAIPLDPAPDPRGNCYFDVEGLVHVLGAQRGLFGDDVPGVRYVPHWATCPDARRAPRDVRSPASPASATAEVAPPPPWVEDELAALAPHLRAATRGRRE